MWRVLWRKIKWHEPHEKVSNHIPSHNIHNLEHRIQGVQKEMGWREPKSETDVWKKIYPWLNKKIKSESAGFPYTTIFQEFPECFTKYVCGMVFSAGYVMDLIKFVFLLPLLFKLYCCFGSLHLAEVPALEVIEVVLRQPLWKATHQGPTTGLSLWDQLVITSLPTGIIIKFLDT